MNSPGSGDSTPRRAPWRDHGVSDPVYYTGRPGTGGGEECRPRRAGILRGNRGLIITLIDIVFVTLLFILFVLFLRPLSNRVWIEPYRVDLSAERIDGNIIVRGTVQYRGRSDRERLNGDGAGEFDGQFQPIVSITAGGVSSRDLAPSPGGRRTIELVVPPGTDDQDALVIAVSIDGTEREQQIEVR